MRRIFYFSGYRMKVFDWQDKRLLGSHSFEPDETGMAEFDHFLATAPLLPAQMLVDIVEEDFRRETIPHVLGGDRKAVVARLIDRHYRDDLHNHVQFQGRSKTGRRDDEVLLSALTNMDLFAPWMKKFAQHKTPLAGIWSLPLLMDDLRKIISEGEANTLIVSRQIITAQRETFFKRGKLMFSRDAKLTADAIENRSAETAVKSLLASTEHIRHFITNQRIIGFTDPATVYCLLPSRFQESLAAKCPDTNLMKYRFVGIDTLFQKFKLENCADQGIDALFAYRCSTKRLWQDHYGQPDEKSAFYRFIVDRSIDVVATLGALVMVTAAVLLWLSNTDIRQQQLVTSQSLAMLERRYQQEYSAMFAQLDTAALIEATLAHASYLRRESAQTPQAYFAPLSSVFSQQRFLPMSISELSWTKLDAENINQILQTMSGLPPVDETADESESGNYAYSSDSASDSRGDGEASEPLLKQQAVIQLIGEVDRSGQSYSDTVLLMEQFIAAFESLPEIADVILVTTPVDIRKANRFTDRSGLDQRSVSLEADRNFYEILLVVRRSRET